MSRKERRKRTAEERELARLQREAKRAEREGRPPPEIPAHLLEPRPREPEPDPLDASELFGEGAPASWAGRDDDRAGLTVDAEPELPPDLEPELPPDPGMPELPPDPGMPEPQVPWTDGGEVRSADPDPPPAPDLAADPAPEPPVAPEPVAPPPEPVAPPEPETPAVPPEPEPAAVPPEPGPRGGAGSEPPVAAGPAPEPPVVPKPFRPAEADASPAPKRRLPHKGEPPGTGSHGAAARDLWRRRGGGRASRGRRVAGLLVLTAVVVGPSWFLVSLLQPLKGEGGERVSVRIPAGAGAGDVADILERRGVVSSAFFFEARATMGGRRGDLQPGTFRLRRDMSYSAALDVLTSGPPPNVVEVTVPEGRSRREVRRIVRRSSLRGDYVAATRRSRALDPRRYGARRARSLEGFLFPDSYELKRRQPVRALVDDQLAAFKREFAKVDLRAARRRKLTPYEVLIVASMIEREAAVPKERPLVSSVIYNRLRRGIPLQIDATVRFATGNWNRSLRESELNVDSAYNTRLRRGLPPGPIGSPGLASIRAAARPARSRFLYYVVKPNTCGEHNFAATSAEFERDKARYDRARRARGGRAPTKC